MEISMKNFCSKIQKSVNTIFNEKQITTIVSSKEDKKIELINSVLNSENITGEIKNPETNSIKLAKKNNFYTVGKFYYLSENYKNMLFNINIKEDIKYYLNIYDEDKLEELLKDFNLSLKILEKCYLDLSDSEFKKILIIIGLMVDVPILIFENPTGKLDLKSIDILCKHLKQLKRQGKIVIVNSYNTDFLLEISNKIIIIDGDEVLENNKYEFFCNEKMLKKMNLKIPNTIMFINIVKKEKNIKLKLCDNINDLIKDVYRNVK